MEIQKKSVAFLGLLSGLSTVLGLVFSIVLAQCYGVSRDVEIYFASSTLFFSIATLTQTGAITEIALPVYHKHIQQFGKTEAVKLYCQILNWMGLAALLVALVSALFSGLIIQIFIPGFSQEDQDKAQLFFLLISPLFILEILKSILSTFLNAEKVFGRTELTNVVSQLGNILFIIFFHKRLGAFAAMMGLWFSQVLSFGYSLYLARKSGFRYHFTWFDQRFSVGELLSKIKNTYAYIIATQFYIIGLNAALSQLPAGHYAVFKYAQLIFSKTQGLLLHPVTTVFFSQFSKGFAHGAKNISQLIIQSNRITILSSIAIFSLVFGVGFPTFCWIWLNEKFDLVNIQLAYRILLVHYILLFFNGLGLIYRKVNMALGWVRGLYLSLSAVNFIFGCLMWIGGDNLYNLYVLTAISIANQIVMALIPPFLVYWYEKPMFTLPPVSFHARALAILVLSLIGIWILKWGIYSLLGIMTLPWIWVLALSALFSGLILIALFYLFRIQEMDLVIQTARKYVARIL